MKESSLSQNIREFQWCDLKKRICGREKMHYIRRFHKPCRDVKIVDIKILSGDLIAKVENDIVNWMKLIEHLRLGPMNGEIFLNFCLNQDFVIDDTNFQQQYPQDSILNKLQKIKLIIFS